MLQFGYGEILALITAMLWIGIFHLIPENRAAKTFGYLAAAGLLIGVFTGYPAIGIIAFLVASAAGILIHVIVSTRDS